MSEMARLALAVNHGYHALGHTTLAVDGGTFVRNTAYPLMRDANHVRDITASAPDDIERLLALADGAFSHCGFRSFRTEFTTPPEFAARLELNGYEYGDTLLMVLEGALKGSSPPAIDVRLTDDDTAWAAVAALKALEWQESRLRMGQPPQLERGAAMIEALGRNAAVRYWTAWADDAPRGYCSSWTGMRGMGLVEDLFVQREYRHRGLATALIGASVTDCRAGGTETVALPCEPGDTPKLMYAAMGFRAVAVSRSYVRLVTDA